MIGLVGDLEVEAALQLTSDALVLELPFRSDGGPRRMVGHEAHAFVRAMPKLFSQLRFRDVVIHGQVRSGRVVAEYRAEGITRAGRPYPNSYVAFFELRDGQVASWREYFNPTVVASAFPPAREPS
ncbi:nuclear transport factor 2 family protein [Acidiferrimicrobium sp. IK]|uniref:nuclear transport factor 2 family protein n=1 Tax=Acidiferrimicrobium sp. IK TaxID=2871700 RepID=UPI0021CB30E2|nr:nuclear transport factor 2 family protein [Acidiferrimicrobium sp. IK]MCU4186669.1 nuclear transport factor 2 family protein [Acidiferrimicrobium sp. IK]